MICHDFASRLHHVCLCWNSLGALHGADAVSLTRVLRHRPASGSNGRSYSTRGVRASYTSEISPVELVTPPFYAGRLAVDLLLSVEAIHLYAGRAVYTPGVAKHLIDID